jgi:hypothetical protein
MNEKNNQSPRKADSLAKNIQSWWSKNLVFIQKNEIKTWHAIAIIAFVGGVMTALIWAVSMNIQTTSRAATNVAVLTWNSNSETDLAGYNIYYGTSKRTAACPTGGYSSKVNAGKVKTYTVNNLTEGQTYYFSITSYDTSGNESCFSSEVSKNIPVTPVTCTSFTYSAWGTCTNGTQTRTVTASSPTGCTGGNPVLSQSCTSSSTCKSFTYSAWSACVNNVRTRTVLSSSPSGCTGGTPVIQRSCRSYRRY